MNTLFKKLIPLLLLSSLAAAGNAVIRTHTNEVNILNIYGALTDIKTQLSKLNDKVDKLKGF